MATDNASASTRFTAWFSPPEREALEAAAKDQNTSINYILRMAVREYLSGYLKNGTA